MLGAFLLAAVSAYFAAMPLFKDLRFIPHLSHSQSKPVAWIVRHLDPMTTPGRSH